MGGNPPRLIDQHGRPLRLSHPAPAYEGAATGRRMSSWGLSSAGPNDTVISGLTNTRARSRELVRNNPWIDGGADTFIAYLIGTSISPRWNIKDKALKEDIQQLWADSVKEMDYDGICDFYGQQALAARGTFESGEVLYRKRILPKSSGLLVPLQIQVIEADLLDHMHSEVYKGNEIRYGIEFNSRGKRIAYWLYREHPGESYGWLKSYSGQKTRIPADEIGHVFRRLRPGQERGIPWLKSAILRAYQLDRCEDAELVRRTMAGLFGGFIKRPLIGDALPLVGYPAGHDGSGNPVVAMEPGTWPELPPGYDVVFSSPPDAGQGFFDLTKHHLRAIAKGTGNTYEKQSGDLSGVNFSSIRAGQNDFLQLIEQLQHHTFVFQFCHPVACLWLDVAVASGAISIRDYAENKRAYQRIEWVPDAPGYVNPLQDVMAKLKRVRAGFASRSQIIAEDGYDIEQVDQEIEEENRRADEKGFVFDSDPRKTAATGAAKKDTDIKSTTEEIT